MMFKGTNPRFVGFTFCTLSSSSYLLKNNLFIFIFISANGTGTFSEMSPHATAFAEELIAYWVSFVRSGDPNRFKLARSPVWEPFTPAEKSRIVLQAAAEGEQGGSGSFLEREGEEETARCEVVAGMVGVQQN
jgi:hypothetical protein